MLPPCCCRGISNKIVDVNCGTYATFATTADGHFHAFGLNNYGQLALPGADWNLVLSLIACCE
jgi:alpha-tubulin suppressor-like RCC1 family protein